MSKLVGLQEPRIKLEPKIAYTDGADAAQLATAYGLNPDPWQRMILDAWLGRDSYDKYTASRCGVLVPRQNGKNAVLEIRELYGSAILGEKILHTAHEVKTARKAFLRLASFFENEREYPELAALVVSIRRTNGQEAILLTNGGSIEFSARSKGAARGFTVDVVICDEAQFLNDEQLESLMPTMAAAPLGNPQIIMVGTPPNHNLEGEVFGRMRKDGHEGKDQKLSWHEWSIDDPAKVNMADPNIWASCNPALGIRLDIAVIQDEFKQMSADGFARERLSMWFDVSADLRAIDYEKWQECATANPPKDDEVDKLAYAVKFSSDGATASLAVAARHNGITHVEIIDHRSMREGVGWLVEFLEPRHKKAATIVIDGLHWSGSLVQELRESGVRNKAAITVPKADEVVTAASGLVDAISRKTVTHYDQPALNASAENAEKRTIGTKGGWGFGGEDCTLIESAALAMWGVKTSKRNPKRKQAML